MYSSSNVLRPALMDTTLSVSLLLPVAWQECLISSAGSLQTAEWTG